MLHSTTLYLIAVCMMGVLPGIEAESGAIEFSFYPIKDAFLSDENVLFRFTITNNYTYDMVYLPWNTPIEPDEPSLLDLTRNGTLILFHCPINSRLPPTRQDYVYLASGASMSAIYNVSNCYTVDRDGNYSANASISLWGCLLESGITRNNFDPEDSCYADLSVRAISFCVVESAGDSCDLPAERAASNAFNSTLRCSSSSVFKLDTLVLYAALSYIISLLL